MTFRRSQFTATGLAILVCAGFIISTPAHADNGKDKGHGKPDHVKSDDRYEERATSTITGDLVDFIIGTNDRRTIKNYIANDYRRHCPPGLAKKNNGCLPPGQAKKYGIGHSLPGDVKYSPIDRALRDLLSPPPRGYEYVKVDKDILLIGEATKKVIDAVTLYSAVGQ